MVAESVNCVVNQGPSYLTGNELILGEECHVSEAWRVQVGGVPGGSFESSLSSSVARLYSAEKSQCGSIAGNARRVAAYTTRGRCRRMCEGGRGGQTCSHSAS